MNPINYLRISLIDRCNFRCLYCMPEEAEISYALQEHWLTNEEILTLLQEVFIPLGFSRFRLTGGEPLLRPGLVDLVRAIAQLVVKLEEHNAGAVDVECAIASVKLFLLQYRPVTTLNTD